MPSAPTRRRLPAACHAVRARTSPAARAYLEKGIEGENEEDGERPRLTKKLDCGLIHRIMEGFFAKHLTKEPNHGTLAYFIIRYRLETLYGDSTLIT
jgi:hypothetical protein